MPVETHRVANSMDEDLQPSAIGSHSHDGGITFVVALTDITRGSYRNIEHPIRPKADELPAMMRIRWKCIVDHNGLRGMVQTRFDVVVAQKPAHFSHV